MDHCVGQHGIIVVLFLALKFGLWHCQEAEASFPPVKLEIQGDSPRQQLLVQLVTDSPFPKSDMDIMFHIQVARSEKMNVIENKYVKSDFSRSPMAVNWTWHSQLPLECDSHSVRFRSRVVGNVPTAETNWSEWSAWKTHPGQNKARTKIEIFPHERVVLEGSNVTFCCLPGRDGTVREMTYDRTKMMPSLNMATDAFIISVKNVARTRSDGVNIVCMVDQQKKGTVLIVSRLPDEPKDFSCETQDMQSLRCHWNPGERYNFYRSLKVTYVLHEWSSQNSQTSESPAKHCDWPILTDQLMYNFTLTAKNLLGERSINAIVYLPQRVRLLAPSTVKSSEVGAFGMKLIWSLLADYTSLQIHCQVALQDDLGSTVNMTIRGKKSAEVYEYRLTELQPYTRYDLRVRCMAEASLAGWSNWSDKHTVWTPEAAPTGTLDVWRRIEHEDDDERIVTLYWKPSSLFRANGNLLHYNIKFGPLEGAPVEREDNVSGVNSYQIPIGRQAYSINVTAHNRAGGSPPAMLRIPETDAIGMEQIATKRTYGTDGGIYVTWQQKASAHGYVIEWCASPRSLHCDLQWKKYNATVQSDVIRSGAFTPGVRYNFRIYGTMKDGERLFEKMAGYSQELACSGKPNVKISKLEPRSIALDWSPYLVDECPEGFVTGYKVYVNDTEEGCKLNKSDKHLQQGDLLCRLIYIGDPDKTQLTVNGLKPNGKYEVAVVAITRGGESSADYIEAHTLSDTGAALLSIIVPIIAVAVLALALLSIGCWKGAWLKRICLPDIPDPNKSKIFAINGMKIKKGVLNRTILSTSNCEAQSVDAVTVQENRQHRTHEEVTSEYQLHTNYTQIQTREGSQCETIESYVPCGNEKCLYLPTNDPPSKPQSLPYQFLNKTYNSALGDPSDSAPGYRPQTNNAAVHCPPYLVQSVSQESGLDDDAAICINSTGYCSEPISPTSVTSTSFMLAD